MQSVKEHPRALSVSRGGKTVVVYVFHIMDRNVRFFFRHGLIADPRVDYVIVQNVPEWTRGHPIERNMEKNIGESKVSWIKRPNRGNDWGAYSEGIRSIDIQNYDFFVFLNSTMRGPFLPLYVDHVLHWTQLYTGKLSDTVAMVGATVNYNRGAPHVQSMLMVEDHRALEIHLEKDIIFSTDRNVRKFDLIKAHEIGSSKVLLDEGYNISCMLSAYRDIDWRKVRPGALGDDPWYNRAYYGYNVHPMECLFVKTNRNYQERDSILEKMTLWYEYSHILPLPIGDEYKQLTIPTALDDAEFFVEDGPLHEILKLSDEEPGHSQRLSSSDNDNDGIIAISIASVLFLLVCFIFYKLLQGSK